jgi:predicted metalloprotease with PDZ domain
VVAALNAVQPYDWATFLKVRVKDVAPKAPLDGLARGGWKLVYSETPTGYLKAVEAASKFTSLTFSLGLSLNRDAEVTGVLWEGPAFNAGITVSTKILAVNGIAFTTDRLKTAITQGKAGKPIALLVKNGDHYRTVSITYTGGLRYPKLERIEGTPDLLSKIFDARK